MQVCQLCGQPEADGTPAIAGPAGPLCASCLTAARDIVAGAPGLQSARGPLADGLFELVGTLRSAGLSWDDIGDAFRMPRQPVEAWARKTGRFE